MGKAERDLDRNRVQPSGPPLADSSILSSSRLATLMSTGLMDSPIEESFDRLTRLAARSLGAPVSLVSLVDEERQFFKSMFGLREPWRSRRETPLTHSFCKHVVGTREPLVIEDARRDPRVAGNLAISEIGVVAYAGIPITLRNGATLGSFCVIDARPRRWSERELETLTDLCAAVVTEIELRLMGQAREELLDVVFHDLKNPASAILLTTELLQREAARASAPGGAGERSRRNLSRIQSAAQRMLQVMQDLRDLIRIESSVLVLETEVLPGRELMEAAADRMRPFCLASGFDLRVDCRSSRAILGDRDRIIRLLSGMICCAIREGASPERPIRLDLEDAPGGVVFSVTDSAPPLSDEDLRHAFDRFWRTPGLGQKGKKLVLCVIQGLAHLHNGRVWLERLPGGGNRFRAQFPAA